MASPLCGIVIFLSFRDCLRNYFVYLPFRLTTIKHLNMRKITLLSLILIVAGQLFAQRVSENQAAQVCQRFLLDRNQLTSAEGLKLAEVYTRTTARSPSTASNSPMWDSWWCRPR